jgi:hypothetical protein
LGWTVNLSYLLKEVHPSDLRYSDIKQFWKDRYPATVIQPIENERGMKIIIDFVAQFPEDSNSQQA